MREETTRRQETGDKEAGGEFSEVMCPQSSSPLPSPLYKCEQVHHPCWLSVVIADSRPTSYCPTSYCGKAEWKRYSSSAEYSSSADGDSRVNK